jgi:hypothetical protein
MTGTDGWVCGNCRSINAARTDRCYSCRSPRSMAVDPTVAAPITKIISDESPIEERVEIARQGGATYQSSAQLAWVVRLEVVVVTIASLGLVGFDIWAIRQEETDAGIEQVASLEPFVLGAVAVLWLLSFVAWGAWLRRVIANVPALGGGWPGTSPDAALVSAVVPGSNLVWGTAVLRDAVVRLSPAGEARLGLLAAWWISLVVAILPWVGSIPQAGVFRFLFRLVGASIAGAIEAVTGLPVTGEELVELMAGGLIVLAAYLAVAIVDHVEELQAARLELVPQPA